MGQIDRVTDGDTIVLMDRTRVRLHGIDAPERDQPYGPIATATLEYMVARSVYLVEVDEDRYGRLVGKLYHSKDGYDINASMVCAGYACWYERYAPDSQVLDDCQVEAQQAPKGLWEDEDRVAPKMISDSWQILLPDQRYVEGALRKRLSSSQTVSVLEAPSYTQVCCFGKP